MWVLGKQSPRKEELKEAKQLWYYSKYFLFYLCSDKQYEIIIFFILCRYLGTSLNYDIYIELFIIVAYMLVN